MSSCDRSPLSSSTMRPIRNRSNSTGPPEHLNSTMREFPMGMFYFLSSLILPALLCFGFVAYHFLRFHQLRSRCTNFLIISLLIINFVHMLADLPARMYYISEMDTLIDHPAFCQIWLWFDNILTTSDLFVVAFTSIDRYLFVFHHRFLKQHKYIFSAVPLAISLALPMIWFSILLFAYPCVNCFRYSAFQCGARCYSTVNSTFGHVENFMLLLFPLAVTAIANVWLIVKVIIRKHQHYYQDESRVWKRNLKMISQLALIVFLYFSVYIPSSILLIMANYGRKGRSQSWALEIRIRYFTHLKYLVIFGCPFVILIGQREMRRAFVALFSSTKIKLRSRFRTQVIPMETVQSTISPTTAP